MAEVINVPKPSSSVMTREHSSLDKPVKKEGSEVEHKEAVILKKPSFGQRLKETFIATDIQDVGDYIVWDIIVPSIGRLINDAICGASNRIFLGGGSTPSNLSYSRGVTRPNVTNYANRSRSQTQSGVVKVETRPIPAQRTRSNFNLNNWGPISRPTAETILSRAVDYLEQYGRITVNDYYEIAEEFLDFDFKLDYTAQNWGWKSLNTAEIVNVTGGSVIKLPNPMYFSN